MRNRRTRFEREPAARRVRAVDRQNATRKKSQGRPRAPILNRRTRRTACCAAFAASIAAGVAASWPALDVATSWWRATPCRVESISVQGNEIMSTQQVAAATGVAKSCLIDDVDTQAVEERLAKHPWIRTAAVTRVAVDQLAVRIEERDPSGALKVDGVDEWRLVDSDGTPFARAAETQLNGLRRFTSASVLEPRRSHEVLRTALSIGAELDRLELDGLIGATGDALRSPASCLGSGW